MDAVTSRTPEQLRPPRRTAGGGGGPPGPQGPAGPAGPAGVGVPAGGTTGQVLEKQSATNYDTVWATISAGGRVTIQPTPPASPGVGDLWWRNDPDGALYVYYDDGNSRQWVPATPTISVAQVAYRYTQASAAPVWSIIHNLPFRPQVTAVDSTGREITPGDVSYPDAVTVQLTFSAAVGGEAYLS